MKKQIINNIAVNKNINKKQVHSTIKLLDEGNTIPFIARYRKEETGNLDEEKIREVKDELEYLRNLEERKEKVIDLIAKQDKLTDELKQKIKKTTSLQELEDLYRPFKKKRKTRASKAINRGLKPLAKKIWSQKIKKGKLEQLAAQYLNPDKELDTVEAVLKGARDIIAEWISDNAEIRKEIRSYTFNNGKIKSEVKNEKKDEQSKYKLYYQYQEPVSRIPPHRILACNRGEKEDILRIKIEVDTEEIFSLIKKKIIENNSIFYHQILEAIKDSYKRLIAPSIEREIRNNLTEKAEEHAIEIFGNNLRNLLLKAPYRNKVIMGIDPGFKSGCKVCVINKRGDLIAYNTIYPHPPQNRVKTSKNKLENMIKDNNVDSIAIGNGTASRETEVFIVEKIIQSGINVNYTIVNEAGASVYSASSVGKKEFPELDVVFRGAVSIARRLQDPLAELVKINPRHIGVGLYQHDVNNKKLEKSLKNVVESVVNYVGVNLNTASPSLLKYVAGISSSNSEQIIEYRKQNKGFTGREELKEVYGIGPRTYQQAAGFLRIFSKKDPLARTPIHPETYEETKELLNNLGYKITDILDKEMLNEIKETLDNLDLKNKVKDLEVGLPTLEDIINSLKKPGYDPREQLSEPIFREDILKIEDLKEGMMLKGTVRNVVDFGAFVDIGVKEDGLVHISELSQEYVENPLEIVQVGDKIKVEVIEIDLKRNRISLRRRL